MYKVFVADKLADEGVEALKRYPEIEIDFAPGLSVEEAIPHAAEADAIIVRSETKIRGELLDAAQKLRVVGRAGIGVDNIDLGCDHRAGYRCIEYAGRERQRLPPSSRSGICSRLVATCRPQMRRSGPANGSARNSSAPN